MRKIQWEHLPREKWAHLRDRAKERQISREDLFALAEWKAEDPDVPDGDWYKDFGTFKLCGKGRLDNQARACPVDYRDPLIFRGREAADSGNYTEIIKIMQNV